MTRKINDYGPVEEDFYDIIGTQDDAEDILEYTKVRILARIADTLELIRQEIEWSRLEK